MIKKDQVWKCVEESADEYGQQCVVIEANNLPEYNGDDDIEIRYEDGSTLYTKSRRFLFNHKLIKDVDKNG